MARQRRKQGSGGSGFRVQGSGGFSGQKRRERASLANGARVAKQRARERAGGVWWGEAPQQSKVRPARLERATSWFVAVNTFVDPTQLTAQRIPKQATTWTQCWTHACSKSRCTISRGDLVAHLPWAKTIRFSPFLRVQRFPKVSTILGICFRSKQIPKEVKGIEFWDSFATARCLTRASAL